MGAFTTWPSWPATGSATGGAAGATGAGRASAGAGAVPRPSVVADAGAMLTAPPLTIFTFSSPSVISNSAMPDSCTRSISFFSLRRSIASSPPGGDSAPRTCGDRKSTRLNSSHDQISYAVFCLKKKKNKHTQEYYKKTTQEKKNNIH